MSQTILGIFAKAPYGRDVKTRLARATGPVFAAALAEAFLRDAVDRYRHIEADKRLVFAPSESRPWFEALAQPDYVVQPQTPGDLGARLAHFFSTCDAGCVPGRRPTATPKRIVVLGTDSPNLPPAWVADAFARLVDVDVVLGPAIDGGYYLIGCRGFFPSLFDLADWGGPTVFAQTVDRIERAGLRLALLPPWYDVDTIDDCRLLRHHLQAQRLAGEDPQAPRTEEWLARAGEPFTTPPIEPSAAPD